MKTHAVILAAGLGKRMKSSLPKVLHPVLGDPSLLWVLRSLPKAVEGAVVVVHHGKERVEAALAHWAERGWLPCPVRTVDQGEPLGTGHAVQRAVSALDELGSERVLILCGDVPLLRMETIRILLEHTAGLLAMDLEDPTGYGRILEHPDGTLAGIVEHKDATPEQRRIRRANGGAYVLPWSPLKAALGELKADNAQREYYLTDAVVAVARQMPLHVVPCPPEELLGMNGRTDQALLQALARDRINRAWMEAGVTFLDPTTTYVGPRVQLGPDGLLEPNVRLEGDVRIGARVRIGQGCILTDCDVGDDVEFRPYCVAHQARVGTGAKVGPFAHLRAGTHLEADVHLGNFVETKQATLRQGAKANHLSYLGDCEIGERSNIGAGCITCNYDGVNKHRTVIGRNVFVGSDCQLVAPVTLGDDSLIGAGTTVTKDVPPGALALSRPPMTLREGRAPSCERSCESAKQA